MKKMVFALFAAGLVAGGDVRAQLTCNPNRLRAGEEIRIGSPGAFGGAPSADVTLSYSNAAGTINRHFGSPRSWSASAVAFLLPTDLPDGVYGVTLSSPAGALRNASCFTIGPPLVAVTTLRAPVGVAKPQARSADAAANPCARPVFQTLTINGDGFVAGTEAHGALWAAGLTWVEAKTDDDAPSTGPYDTPTLRWMHSVPRIVSPTKIEIDAKTCFPIQRGAKVRVWFPDGTKSDWISVHLPLFG